MAPIPDALSILEQQYVEALVKCPGMMRRFVEEYLYDLNGRRAAAAAGYKSRLDVAAHRCLADPRVKNAISAGELIKAERTMLKVSGVLNELAAIVHSDMRDYRVSKKTGKLKLRPGALPSAFKAVASTKIKTRKFKRRDGVEVFETEQEIRLWDKNAAIEKAMRHLGLLRNDVHVHDSALERFLRDRAAGLHAQVIAAPGPNPVPANRITAGVLNDN